jgi:hypothetical protein
VAWAALLLAAVGVAGGVLAGGIGELWLVWVPMAKRFSRGSAATAAAITLVTTPITAMTATTITAIRLGPKGYVHLLHARLKPPDNH